MTEQDPRDQLAQDIVNLSREKYGMEINDVIMTCLHVATALTADEATIGEEDEVRKSLLKIVETGFDLAFQAKHGDDPDAGLKQ